MGNNSSDLTESEFKQKWRLVERGGNLQLWQNIENPSNRVEQYFVRDSESSFSEKLYELRRTNPYLVNACALKQDGVSCRMDHDGRKLFVEVIPFRLSNVKDIPYPDALHLYDAAIHGFGQLSEAVGPFGVDEDMVGIDEKGRVKVWLSSQFESFRVQGAKVTESVMVKGLLTILDAAVDHSESSRYPHVGRFIGSHDNVTFKQARERFIEYVRVNGMGGVPQNLNCVFEHGGKTPIEQWCREHNSYGFGDTSNRGSEQLFRTKYSGQVGGSTIQGSLLGQGQQNGQTRPSGQVQPIGQVQPLVPQLDSQSSIIAPVGNSGDLFTRSTQPIGDYAYLPTSQTIGEPKRFETQGYSVVEDRTFAGRIVEGVPSLYQAGNIQNQGSPVRAVAQPRFYQVNDGIKVSQVVSVPGQSRGLQITPIAPTIQRPISVGSGVQGFVSRQQVPVPLPPITASPYQVKVASQGNSPAGFRFFSQESVPQIQQQQRLVYNEVQPDLTYPPQFVESAYFKPKEMTTTSKILQNLQGKVVTESKGDSVVATVPVGFQDNKLQQQRVISQSIDLKEGVNPFGGMTKEAKFEYIPKPYADLDVYGGSGLDGKTEIGQQKYDIGKFSPGDDGKSSPQFLALLNEFKSGGKSYQSEGYSGLSSYGTNNQQLGRLNGYSAYS